MGLSEQIWVMTGAGGVVAACLRTTIAPQVAALRLVDIKALECRHEREEAYTIDVRNQLALEKVLAGAHGVLHLGGLADEADFHDLLDVNIIGTYNILEAARRVHVPRVVFASSNRLTGFYSVEDTVSSSMATRPDGFYGVSKVAGEALCRLYVDKFGLQVASIRIGSFEESPQDERQLSTWLSPADCVRAFLAAMTSTELTFCAFYGVSRNTRGWWDLNDGLVVGYDPQDNAEVYAQSLHIEATTFSKLHPQGGMYATPEYTLDRQRQLMQK